MSKSYSDMLRLNSFDERFDYLALQGSIGHSTFGFARWINQSFYTSTEWRQLRQRVIARDEGMDLGVPGYEIFDKVIIHHIIPLTPEDFENDSPLIRDMDNLITTTHDTHNAIHYGGRSSLRSNFVERTPGDTNLWNSRKGL